ncbi:MAG: lipopolysaccharide heptosyltransferase II [Pseudomonadota bacterium]
MKRVLVVGPAWVGDMVMAQSLFKRIKRLNPDCVLHVVAPGWSLPLTDRMAEVDQAHALDVSHGVFGFGARRLLGDALKQYEFDTAFILPRSWKSALVPYFAGAWQRIGYLGEWRYGLLTDLHQKPQKPIDRPKPRTVDSFVALADAEEPVVREEEWPLLETRSDARSLLPELDLIDVDPGYIVFCPGAEYGPAKQWPLPHFAELGRQLVSTGRQILISGSAKDAPAAEQIAGEVGSGAQSIAGKTSLSQAIDVLSHAGGVVSNDSGLMHVAAALQRPTIAMFGSSSELVTPPLSNTAKTLSRQLPCRPCFQRTCPLHHLDCLNGITPAVAAEALSKAMTVH